MPKIEPDVTTPVETKKKKGKAKTTNTVAAEPKSAKPEKKDREIRYSQVSFKPCIGEKTLTMEEAKKILGWHEQGEKEKFDEWHFLDWNGNKIICHNNLGNRPFDAALARTYMSDILNGRWYFNGETMIVTKSALVASGQHRLIGFIWACQEWEKNKEKWPLWESEPTMECLVVFGIDDRDEVINTIDTGKSRSLANVVYRSEIFSAMKPTAKIKCSKMLENAIKWLYYRIGAAPDALAPGKSTKRTISESMDFYQRHEKLLSCIKHIHEEDAEEGKIKRYMPLGYAAATLYMMGCSATDPKEYRETDNPSEDLLDWSNYDKALEFWTALANGDKDVGAMRQAQGDLIKEGLNNVWTQSALVCKAWAKYVAEETLLASDLEIAWDENDDGVKKIAECPTVGGIDIGQPDDKTPDPTPAEIAASKAAIKMENVNGKITKVKVDVHIGDRVTVQWNGQKAWEGELIDIVNGEAKVKDSDGDIIEIPMAGIKKIVTAKVQPKKVKTKK